MWLFLTIIFEILINLLMFGYLNKVKPKYSILYSKDLFLTFIKHGWGLGLLSLILLTFRLNKNLMKLQNFY